MRMTAHSADIRTWLIGDFTLFNKYLIRQMFIKCLLFQIVHKYFGTKTGTRLLNNSHLILPLEFRKELISISKMS